MKAKNVLVFLILTALTSIIFWRPQIIADQPAPDVTFKTITNKNISLNHLQGHPVIITFWASDCPACIKEIPHLKALYQQYHSHGLEIIAVAMYYDPPSHVVAISKTRQLPYDIALDLKAEHSKAFGNVMLTPTTFLISPKGNIVMQKQGMFDLNNMEQKIELLLQRTTKVQSF